MNDSNFCSSSVAVGSVAVEPAFKAHDIVIEGQAVGCTGTVVDALLLRYVHKGECSFRYVISMLYQNNICVGK